MEENGKAKQIDKLKPTNDYSYAQLCSAVLKAQLSIAVVYQWRVYGFTSFKVS